MNFKLITAGNPDRADMPQSFAQFCKLCPE